VLQRVWQEHDYRIDVCHVTKGGYIEHLYCRTETWSVSPSVDMLPQPGCNRPGCCTAEFGNPGGTYGLPCTFILKS
jgi:hypothetical protein